MLIRVFDFETTGLDHATAKVIEVGVCDIDTGTNTIKAPRAAFCGGVDQIPPEVRAVNHMSVDLIKNCPPFVPGLFLDGARAAGVDCLAAHNVDFDAGFLGGVEALGFPTICTDKVARRLFGAQVPGFGNQVLRYWLEDQGMWPRDFDVRMAMPAHSAGADAYVTAMLLTAMAVAVDVDKMIEWSKEPKVLPVCPIGKFRGKPWADVDGGFLAWMLKQPDMGADLVAAARAELDRRGR